MNIQSKQRVIGIIVLVGFVALLIPFLFVDSNKVSKKQVYDVDMPINMEVAPPNVNEKKELKPATIKTTILPKSNKNEVDIDLDLSNKNKPEPVFDSNTTVTPKIEKKVITEVPLPEPKPVVVKQNIPKQEHVIEKMPEPVKKAVVSEPKIVKATKPNVTKGHWVVQVGSFTDQQSVEKLMNSLQSKGYHPYTKKAVTSKGNVTKVLVGKETTKRRAEYIAENLRDMFKFNATIINI